MGTNLISQEKQKKTAEDPHVPVGREHAGRLPLVMQLPEGASRLHHQPAGQHRRDQQRGGLVHVEGAFLLGKGPRQFNANTGPRQLQ